MQEDASQNQNDAVTLITVIPAAVITSILFAFKTHISTSSATGVPQNVAKVADVKSGVKLGSLNRERAWQPLKGVSAV